MTARGIWAILLGIVLQNFSGSAAAGFQPSGGRSAAMANASVTLFDPWGIINNQAGIVNCSTLVFGIYGENRFLMKELGYQAGFILIPLKPGVAGLSFARYGYTVYNENRVGLTFARSFGDHFHSGIQLVYNYCYFNEKRYRLNQVTFEAGFITQINRDLCLALHVTDPLTLTAGKQPAFTSRYALIQLGASLQLSDRIILLFQAEKDLASDLQFMAGFEYRLSPLVSFRSGFTAHPVQLTFGTGTQWNKLIIDVAATMHQQLGWFPQVSLHFIAR
jgi:hypothetical protein